MLYSPSWDNNTLRIKQENYITPTDEVEAVMSVLDEMVEPDLRILFIIAFTKSYSTDLNFFYFVKRPEEPGNPATRRGADNRFVPPNSSAISQDFQIRGAWITMLVEHGADVNAEHSQCTSLRMPTTDSGSLWCEYQCG
jgi:hypothetical protein